MATGRCAVKLERGKRRAGDYSRASSARRTSRRRGETRGSPCKPCAKVAQGLLDDGGNLRWESQEHNRWRKHPIAYSAIGASYSLNEASYSSLRAVLHLMVHHIEYKPIQRQ